MCIYIFQYLYRENIVENDEQAYTLRFQKIMMYVHSDFKLVKRVFLEHLKMPSCEC